MLIAAATLRPCTVIVFDVRGEPGGTNVCASNAKVSGVVSAATVEKFRVVAPAIHLARSGFTIAPRVSSEIDLDTHAPQELRGRRHVVEMRNVAERHGPVGEQRRAQDRQRGVLRAGDPHLAVEARAAVDRELVQGRALRGARAGGRHSPRSAHSSGV